MKNRENSDKSFDWSNWVEDIFGSKVEKQKPLAGGCISDVRWLQLSNQQELVIKLDFSGRFSEPESYALAQINLRVPNLTPKVLASTKQCLVLEYIPEGRSSTRLETKFAEKLAELHSHTETQFGFSINNYCGATPQPNDFCESGYEFFANNRLIYQADLAKTKGLLIESIYTRILRLADRLKDLIPESKPVFLHGDLWSGNCLFGAAGETMLIDPASYFGWAEADLAMTKLFGGFSTAFYESYRYHSGINNDWVERIDIYNLYHLINHLNLFGSSYLPAIKRVLRVYGC